METETKLMTVQDVYEGVQRHIEALEKCAKQNYASSNPEARRLAAGQEAMAEELKTVAANLKRTPEISG